MSVAIAPLPAAERGSALGRLALTELKLFARERLRIVFGVGLPLLLVIIIGCIPFFNQPRAAYGGATFLDIYVPIMVAFSAALLSLTALPMMLAGYRERGVLRRLQTTPIGASRVLAAQLLANLAVVLGTSIAILLLARFGFGVAFPRQLAGFVIAALLAAVALMCVGLFIAAVVPSSRAAQATGGLLFYPLMFFAGAVAADRQYARHPAAHQPRHPAGGRGAGTDGFGPGVLADLAAAGHHGRLRGGVRAGRRLVVPLGVN